MIQTHWSSVVAGPLGAALLALALCGPAAAQDPLGRPAARDTIRLDAVLEEMQTQLEVLLPAMRRLALTLQETLPELAADTPGGAAAGDVEAVARRAARLTRAYFDALLAEGFTREEALHIVAGAGFARRP